MIKDITVAFYGRRFSRDDWRYDIDEGKLSDFLRELATELAPLGIRLQTVTDDSQTIEIKGYGDLLNSIRLRSPRDHIGNQCLGHVIGTSQERDLFADLRRGVNRVAFAPETIEPEGSHKVVCHNCGCGC